MGDVKFYETRLSTHEAGLVAYDSNDPVKMEAALSRGALLLTTQLIGGEELFLRKEDSEYVVSATTPPTGPTRKFPHKTLDGALNKVAELVKLAGELEAGGWSGSRQS